MNMVRVDPDQEDRGHYRVVAMWFFVASAIGGIGVSLSTSIMSACVLFCMFCVGMYGGCAHIGVVACPEWMVLTPQKEKDDLDSGFHDVLYDSRRLSDIDREDLVVRGTIGETLGEKDSSG